MSIPDLTAASWSLVEALEDDPFYRAITIDYAADPARRRAALQAYFTCSMAEGISLGRLTLLPGDDRGAAVWLLPATLAPPALQAGAGAAKAAALAVALGVQGLANYQRIIDFMAPISSGEAPILSGETPISSREAPIISGEAPIISGVGKSAWYLSIIGVAPRAQGQGLGARLLQPTLREADQAGAVCFLETFSARNLHFYQRMGFALLDSYLEPVTAAQYWIMARQPM